MQQSHRPRESGHFGPRLALAFALCLMGGLLATFAFVPAKPTPAPERGPMLANWRTNLSARSKFGAIRPLPSVTTPAVASSASSITFGHPVISGIGGTGFEQD